MSCYAKYGNFSPNAKSAMSNPLTYCAVTTMDSGFNHTLGATLLSPGSSQCQAFMSQYCASKWDSICEIMSRDQNRNFPNSQAQCNQSGGPAGGNNWLCDLSSNNTNLGNTFTNGEILIRNAAAEKYLSAMSDNCIRKYEPFDPTVPDSPLISKWMPVGNSCGNGSCGSGGGVCIPIYAVDPKTIDNDPVMNKIIAKPAIAMDILINMYKWAKRNNTLKDLQHTKLYKFIFSQQWFQNIAS
jgi:hypothetical protein